MSSNTIKTTLAAVTLALGAMVALPAAAAVVTGTLHSLGTNVVNGGAGSVDYWSITQTSAGTTSFDILSWTAFPTYLDTQIFLYSGSAATGNLLAQNDDSSATYGDGSVNGLDSYLSLYLNAGSYTLAVATCCTSGDSVRNGVQQYTYFRDNSGYGANNGQYQLTVTGDATVADPNAVPEPTSLLLASAALAGVVLVRRKR